MDPHGTVLRRPVNGACLREDIIPDNRRVIREPGRFVGERITVGIFRITPFGEDIPVYSVLSSLASEVTAGSAGKLAAPEKTSKQTTMPHWNCFCSVPHFFCV
jgi:hypothetical protein